MKRNLNQQLVDLDGQPFKDGSTLKNICEAAAGVQLSEDAMTPVEQKLKRLDLLKKIHASDGVIDFTAEEIVLLKDRIGKIFPVMAIGQAFEMLDSDYQEPVANQ